MACSFMVDLWSSWKGGHGLACLDKSLNLSDGKSEQGGTKNSEVEIGEEESRKEIRSGVLGGLDYAGLLCTKC